MAYCYNILIIFNQELYEKSLVGVEDNSLPVDLLELKIFFSVPQVSNA